MPYPKRESAVYTLKVLRHGPSWPTGFAKECMTKFKAKFLVMGGRKVRVGIHWYHRFINKSHLKPWNFSGNSSIVLINRDFGSFLGIILYEFSKYFSCLCSCIISNGTLVKNNKITQHSTAVEVKFIFKTCLVLLIFCPDPRPSSLVVSPGLPTGQSN